MKRLMQINSSEKGFTLLEVIITITIAAILGSLLVTFMGTAITKSSDPIKQVRDLGTSGGSIETASAAYACYLSGCTGCTVGTGGTCTWGGFETVCASGGRSWLSVTSPSTGGIYSSNFETIQVTVTNGSQKLVSYFMQ